MPDDASQSPEDVGAFLEDAIDEHAGVVPLGDAPGTSAGSVPDAIVQDVIASMLRLSNDPARRREIGLRLV